MDTFSPSVDVDLGNLLHNLRQIRMNLSPATGIIAVVKDCAYGCGATVVSRILESDGNVACFAVARTAEARVLRENGIKGTLIVLGKADDDELRQGHAADITFTCNDLDDIHRWNRSGLPVRFHCNIDTGMRRLGIQPGELPDLITLLQSTAQLQCTGIFTHMASADVPGTGSVYRQYELFRSVLAGLKTHGMLPQFIHCANSATIIRFPVAECTHVRPGIALYGCRPDPRQDFGIDLRPVLTLKGTVVSLRPVPSSTPVGYGGNYVTTTATTIATISAGYAHGIPRYLSNRGEVLIKGQRYRIAGNVTMDYIMVDAGPNPQFSIGEEAVIIGSQGDEHIFPDDVAIIGNTTGYEVLCNIGTSIPRNYTMNGIVVESVPGRTF